MATKVDLFEDIAAAIDSWADSGTAAITDCSANLEWTEDSEPYKVLQSLLADGKVDQKAIRTILAECLRGFAVSILTTLDGGSALAEKGRLYVVDERGAMIGDGLHNDFFGHLMDTGRI